MAILALSEFDRVFASAVKRAHRETSDQVTPELEPYLRHFFDAFVRSIQQDPVDEQRVARSLRPLLVYLTTPAGRTNANCCATDLFVSEMPWNDDVPDNDLFDVVRFMDALHDTVSAPHIAENFFSTPEQLLARLDAWIGVQSALQRSGEIDKDTT